MKRALILGISGQDGAYLARHLLQQGYHVFGTMPDASTRRFLCLRTLGIFDKVPIFQLSLQDFSGVLHLLDQLQLDEIYNLSSQVECGYQGHDLRVCEPDLEQGTRNVLEAVRVLGRSERFLLAASGEASDLSDAAKWGRPLAGRSKYEPAMEEEARACAHVSDYRERYGIFASTGIVYNRASPIAPRYTLGRRIAAAAAQIAAGYHLRLTIEDAELPREWGWAPEYADAIQRILQQSEPADFVIATGEAHSALAFAEAAFASAGLDWQDHVDLVRNGGSRHQFQLADTGHAHRTLGWKAEVRMEGVASLLVSSERMSGIV